ncbi:MAG: hypothetical protein JSU94_12040 [Phycisphaerales bacterium]|nr:MAG: hypothetical protein JSU94_12040 [Phycisphaerales bacterium]
MDVIAKCPRCGMSRLLDAAATDRRIRCRRCNRLFKVPSLDEIPKATSTIKQARTTIHVDEDGRTYG